MNKNSTELMQSAISPSANGGFATTAAYQKPSSVHWLRLSGIRDNSPLETFQKTTKRTYINIMRPGGPHDAGERRWFLSDNAEDCMAIRLASASCRGLFLSPVCRRQTANRHRRPEEQHHRLPADRNSGSSAGATRRAGGNDRNGVTASSSSSDR